MGDTTVMKNKKLLIVGGFLVLLVLIGLGFAGVQSFTFQLAKSYPDNNGTLNVGNSIILTYNRDIQDGAKITAPFTYTTKVDGAKLYVTPNAELAQDRPYQITVSGVKEKNGSAVAANTTLIFKVAALPFNTLPKEQQDELSNTDNIEYRLNPVSAILPIAELEYAIDSAKLNGKYYTVITPAATPSAGLTEDEYNAEYKREYDEGVALLKEKGFDAKKVNAISDQDYAKLQSKTTEGSE